VRRREMERKRRRLDFEKGRKGRGYKMTIS